MSAMGGEPVVRLGGGSMEVVPPPAPAVRLSPAPDVPLEEVEWRVDSEPYEKNGRVACRYVPYLDAAITARLLDEWVGPGNWSDQYATDTLDGKPCLWCVLSIRVGDEWVSKRDIGTASNMEAQKGLVSDAFKRAAILKWGVGRNVYSLPTLWGPCNQREKNGKKTAYPNNDTKPDLMRQLRARGFTNATPKIAASDTDSGEQPADAPATEGGPPLSPSVQSGEGESDLPPTPSLELPINGDADIASRACEKCGSIRAKRVLAAGNHVVCANTKDCDVRAEEAF